MELIKSRRKMCTLPCICGTFRRGKSGYSDGTEEPLQSIFVVHETVVALAMGKRGDL